MTNTLIYGYYYTPPSELSRKYNRCICTIKYRKFVEFLTQQHFNVCEFEWWSDPSLSIRGRLLDVTPDFGWGTKNIGNERPVTRFFFSYNNICTIIRLQHRVQYLWVFYTTSRRKHMRAYKMMILLRSTPERCVP